MQLGIVDGEPIGARLTARPGFSPIGLPAGGWGTTPSEGYAVAPTVTVTTAGTVDWSVAGVFVYQLTSAQAFAPTFANAMVGQVIFLVLKQPASSTAATLTLPTGTITAGSNAATITISSTNSFVDVVRLICVSPGVYYATLN
jgi:hypothetical protein